MSVGTTYVKSSDGKWYAEPSLRGVTKDGKQWYLCFDEDDPPELVVQVGGANPVEILKSAGVSFSGITKNGVSGRCIGEAASYWVNITKPIPTPTKHDGAFDKPDRIGAYLLTSRRELKNAWRSR